MANQFEVLLTVHFVTFLLACMVFYVPFFSWFLSHFLPTRAIFLDEGYASFLGDTASSLVKRSAATSEALACLHLLKMGPGSTRYRSMEELRNAALIRFLGTFLGCTFNGVAIFSI